MMLEIISHEAAEGNGRALFGDFIAPRRPPSLCIAFSVLEADTHRAAPSKTFGVDLDGKPTVTVHGGQPAAGTIRRVALEGTAGGILAKLGNVLEGMTAREALICAPPPAGPDVQPFATVREAAETPGTIARTKAAFPAPVGTALFGLDFDVKAWPADLQERVKAFDGQLSGVLASVVPGFADAACLVRASSSAGVRNRETGAQTDPNAGQHRFFLASDGREVAGAIARLHGRLILAGWGWPFVSEAGIVDVRSLVDVAASGAFERLWFEGAAQLADQRLEFIPGARKAVVRNGNGGSVDLAGIAPLSDSETAQLDDAIAGLQASVAAEASAKRRTWKERSKARYIARGVDPTEADRIVDAAAERKALLDDFLISFDDGTAATVSEILADPMAFHRKTGPDPLEPEYGGGRNKAILFADARPVRVESQAHGGVTYMLQEAARFFEPLSAKPAAEPKAADAASPPQLFADGPEPLDIFGDADPVALSDPPLGSLHPMLERWARSEARRKGVPLAFPAAAAVAVLSSAVGASLSIRVRQHDDWSEPASLWLTLIAPPGSTKTPVISAAADPLRKLDAEWLKADAPIHAEWAKAAKRANRKDAAPLGPEPRIRRAVVDDVTAERLVGIFADNPNGLLRDTDELAALLGGLGQYKRGSDADRAQLLRLFDGGAISRDRQTTGSVFASRALLGILAGSQPAKITSLVKDLGDDGLLQRFLFVMHDGIERTGVDEAPDAEAAGFYARLVRGLKCAEYGFAEPIRLAPAANDAMKAAGMRLDRLRHLPGAGGAFRDHVSKLGKIVPRLVLTFHAVEAFSKHGRIDPAISIEAATVEMAARFAGFLALHSIRFYETFFGTPDAVSDARWVAGHLLTKPELRELGRRDIYDARKSLRGPDFRPLLAAMGELEAAGWVEVTKTEADGPTRWKVNSCVHKRFAERAVREASSRADRHERITLAGQERRRIVEEMNGTAVGVEASASVFD